MAGLMNEYENFMNELAGSTPNTKPSTPSTSKPPSTDVYSDFLAQMSTSNGTPQTFPPNPAPSAPVVPKSIPVSLQPHSLPPPIPASLAPIHRSAPPPLPPSVTLNVSKPTSLIKFVSAGIKLGG